MIDLTTRVDAFTRWRLAVPAIGVAALLTLAGCATAAQDAPTASDVEGVPVTEQGQEPAAADEPAEEAAEPDEATEAVEDAGAGDSGLTAVDIIAAVEPHDFGCEEEEPVLKSRVEKVVCRGPNYAFITATKLGDESDMQNQLTKAKDALCESDFTDEDDVMTTAVSGAWVLVPGGSDEHNMALYEAAMADLGLESTQDPCSA